MSTMNDFEESFVRGKELGKGNYGTVFQVMISKDYFNVKFDGVLMPNNILKVIARHSKHNGECLLSPPSFLCSQMITPFSHSMRFTNQETGL